jgi:2Fe-2S ferredoxin
MPKVTYIEPSGSEVELDVPVGWSVMQAAMSNGVDGVEAECGGSCACATCHCYVEALGERLSPPAENESAMLANVVAPREPNSRLSCQIKMTAELDGLVVRYPDVQS